jgi:hypothetical protein
MRRKSGQRKKHLAWLVARLSYLPCRNWCNVIIIIMKQAQECADHCRKHT